jgi:hypothetical protein
MTHGPVRPSITHSQDSRILTSNDPVPHVVGRWRPHDDDDNELYCASLLTLFKPWRTWQDLKTSSYADSLENFMDLDHEAAFLISNMRYTHSVRC